MRINLATCLTALLLLLTAPAARGGCPVSAEMSVTPEAPTSADEVVVTVEGVASNTCVPQLLSWSKGPVIELDTWRPDGCSATPSPYTLEVPLGQLAPGPYWVFFEIRNEPDCAFAFLFFEVSPAGGEEYSLAFEPTLPVAGQAALVRFSGARAACPDFSFSHIEGSVLTFRFDPDCAILPPGIGPFTEEHLLPPLAPGVHTVRVELRNGELLAEEDLSVLEHAELGLGQKERFIARARFQTREGDGEGQAVKRTRDSGHFWFFDPDNIELTVKLIDACHSFGRFWVFATGMTNVGVELTVEDRQTGEVRVYENELGTSFAPILDNQAFATCPEEGA